MTPRQHHQQLLSLKGCVCAAAGGALWLGLICVVAGCQVRMTQTWPDGSKTEYLNSRIEQQFDRIEFRKGDTVVIVHGAKGDSTAAMEAAGKIADAAAAVAGAAK
jgi:hypothetical protein